MMEGNLETATTLAATMPPSISTTTNTLHTTTGNTMATSTGTASISERQQDILNKLDLAPATLEALKTLSAISSSEGIEKFYNCDKLTASLEQIRANKNMKLFEKLDKIKKDFSGLNHEIAMMESSLLDLKQVTRNLVKSLPSTATERKQRQQKQQHQSAPSEGVNSNNNDDTRLENIFKEPSGEL